MLPLYDESSIVETDMGQSICAMQGGSENVKSGPVASTHSVSVPKSTEQTSISALKSHDKSGVKINLHHMMELYI